MSAQIPEWAKTRVTPHVLAIPEYIPGKPIAEVEREFGIFNAIKLASNENPLGPSPKAIEAIAKNIHRSNIYPESTGPKLRKSLAEYYKVPLDQIVLGNGSDEIMQMLAHVFVGVGDEVIMPENSFSMYKIVTRFFGGKSVTVALKSFRPDLDSMAAAITGRTRMLFLSNPHSPTGTVISKAEFEELLAVTAERGVILVLDEAYREYVETADCPSGINYIDRSEHLIFLRTFSKIYGLAGLRVGYGIAQPWIIQLLNRVRPPFNVNLLAQEAAEAALWDESHVTRSRDVNSLGKRFLLKNLAALGFDPIPTESNFVAFRANCDTEALYIGLLKQGVIVRHLKSFGLPSYIRVTIGLEDQNIRFMEALKKVNANLPRRAN
ncbi:MAG: histidinol-phosphate transaminase [Desulfomonilaceae bacterium]